jgi:hypothetical protein
VEPSGAFGRFLGFVFRVCDAARRRRLVVPRAFVEPDLAEHTTATLLSSM